MVGRRPRTAGAATEVSQRRVRGVVPAFVLAVVVGLVAAGCARGDEFPDRTAFVRIGGATQEFALDSCGRDGRTVFLVGRADDGTVLQGVLGLRQDLATGVRASTGLTLDRESASSPDTLAAFGQESWERQGRDGPAPGTITAARLRGSRVQFSGEAVAIDETDDVVDDVAPARFSVDARCDEPS